ASAARTVPNADVERNALGSLLRRRGSAHGRVGAPTQLLRGKSLHARGRKNAGQGSGKTETIRQHEFGTHHSKLMAEIFIAIEHLADDRFGRRRIDIVLLHRRSGGEPAAFLYVLP